MLDFDFLKKKFYQDCAHMIPDRVGHLSPSQDSAVGQFRNHFNSVGFMPVYSCPGATRGKGGCVHLCYAVHGRGNGTAVQAKLSRNTNTLFHYCRKQDAEGLAEEFVFLVDASTRQYERRLARTAKGEKGVEYRRLRKRGSIFRFQWAGDLIHPTHAIAMRMAAERRPDVSMWTYTRSFHLLQYPDPKPENLTVFTSMDVQNQEEALAAHEEHPWTKLASMTADQPDGSIICPKYKKHESEGACAKCGMCFTGKAEHVWFPVKRYITGERPCPLGEKVLEIC